MIITYEEQQIIKPSAQNDEVRFIQIMEEVDRSEVRKLLGNKLYFEIKKTPSNFVELIEGCDFEYRGVFMNHLGLRYVIAYLNYASYIVQSYAHDTFTGVVEKKREDSETLSIGKIKNLANLNREIAMNEFENVKMYMCAVGLRTEKSNNIRFFAL